MFILGRLKLLWPTWLVLCSPVTPRCLPYHQPSSHRGPMRRNYLYQVPPLSRGTSTAFATKAATVINQLHLPPCNHQDGVLSHRGTLTSPSSSRTTSAPKVLQNEPQCRLSCTGATGPVEESSDSRAPRTVVCILTP